MTDLVPENFPDLPRALVADFARARKELARIAPRLRYAYVDGRAQGMNHNDSVRYAQRLDAIRRRWKREAKPCERCCHPVLWRSEQGRNVAIDKSGRPHACA